MNILFTTIVSAIVAIASAFSFYNYVPLSVFDTQDAKLGTSITTILGSDTLSSSRTTINDNFTALNSGKIEVSTTTLPNLTTLANLATVGTITTGSWNATAIPVNKGGTGTTSPSVYMVMLGNGANGLTMATSTGTTGQAFISNGAGAYPSWQNATVNQGIDYTWTGKHTFSATTTIAASSLLNAPLELNGLGYTMPTGRAASSTVLMENGSGNLTWNLNRPIRYTMASTTASDYLTATASTATSTRILNIPANTLTASSTIQFYATLDCNNSSNGDADCQIYLRDTSGVSIFGRGIGTDTATNNTYLLNTITTSADGTSASSLITVGGAVNTGALKGASTVGGEDFSASSTFNLANGINLVVVVGSAGANTTVNLKSFSIIVNP